MFCAVSWIGLNFSIYIQMLTNILNSFLCVCTVCSCHTDSKPAIGLMPIKFLKLMAYVWHKVWHNVELKSCVIVLRVRIKIYYSVWTIHSCLVQTNASNSWLLSFLPLALFSITSPSLYGKNGYVQTFPPFSIVHIAHVIKHFKKWPNFIHKKRVL